MRSLILGALLIAGGALPAGAATTVPLLMLGDGHFGVNVSVGGRAPQLFAIDTGAEMTYAPNSLVTRLGLKSVGTFSFLSPSGMGFQVPMYALPPLRIGDVTLPGTFAEDWDGLDKFAVPPLLSLWSFTDGPVTFDLAKKTLTFEDAGSFAAITRNAQRAPLAAARDRDRSLLVFVDVDFPNGAHGQCLLDTGSGATTLDARYLPAFGMNKSGDARVLTTYSEQPEGPRREYTAKIASIALSAAPSLRMTNAQVAFIDHPIYDCELGNDFWVGNVFTLDLPHDAMYVVAAKG